ncbi:MAG: His-Xaa-Ser system radical SAM maturase HxsB [Rhodocyclaceae bacterium]
MTAKACVLPYRSRAIAPDHTLVVSDSGDHALLDASEARALELDPSALSLDRLAELKSKFFVGDQAAPGFSRLLASRQAARRETVLSGPSLHIFVTTLRCTQSCRYCQVSRALDSTGFTMSLEDLNAACDTIFQSRSPTLTVEFQGGDPMLRFDLIEHAVERITNRNRVEGRRIRFVVATTLHHLTDEHCAFFRLHKVYLSTSLDGPVELHNKNRPLLTRDAYERTIDGLMRARECLGSDSVSALMTTTRDSLLKPIEIVDEYVRRGFHEIFLRPMSSYGFARRNEQRIGYATEEFQSFYSRAFERILEWNAKGIPVREVTACVALNKMLSPFDCGFVNLQTPTGAGLGALVYNYDGYVYPSDESRMLAEMGDTTLRLGRIGEPLAQLLRSPVQRSLISASLAAYIPGCKDCAYNVYCGPDPIEAHARMGSVHAPVSLTDHCKYHLWLFDYLFDRLHRDDAFRELAYRWGNPWSSQGGVDA